MNNNPNGYYAAPPMMNPPPRIFGSGTFDPSQMPHGSMFAHDDLDDQDGSDPKRRRIARVRPPYPPNPRRRDSADAPRPAICAARRRSSATARCPRAPTA